MVSNVGQAGYAVVESHGAIEIRDFAPMVVAEVSVPGNREQAIGDGFRRLADFISGNNSAVEKVAMTAPVIQQPGARIAMTAPFARQAGERHCRVRFVMPPVDTLQTLPKPDNPDVVLKAIDGKRYAVSRFSGRPDGNGLAARTGEVETFVQPEDLQVVPEPVYALFDPPWTMPLLRRNEVMLEINRPE